MNVLSQFNDLKLYIEHDELPIVYYNGNFYWVGEDSDIPKDFIVEDDEIEPSSLAIRAVIGTGNYISNEPYNNEWGNDKDFTYGFCIDNENGYLPDSRNRVYKLVDKSLSNENFVIDNNNKYYCIRNGGCEKCEHNTTCNPIIERVFNEDRNYNMVACDISAQEPLLITYATGESNYLSVFRNRHLRNLDLLVYLDVAMSDNFNIDVNNANSAFNYWSWVDSTFHHKYEDLIIFNYYVERLRDGDEKAITKIESYLNMWFNSFNNYMNDKQI